MRGQGRIIWLSLAVLAAATVGAFEPSRAQEAQRSGPVTLGQAVHMALEQNPAFRESNDEAQATRARFQQVQSAWFPRFDFHQDFTRGNNPICVFGANLLQSGFTRRRPMEDIFRKVGLGRKT